MRRVFFGYVCAEEHHGRWLVGSPPPKMAIEAGVVVDYLQNNGNPLHPQ